MSEINAWCSIYKMMPYIVDHYWGNRNETLRRAYLKSLGIEVTT